MALVLEVGVVVYVASAIVGTALADLDQSVDGIDRLRRLTVLLSLQITTMLLVVVVLVALADALSDEAEERPTLADAVLQVVATIACLISIGGVLAVVDLVVNQPNDESGAQLWASLGVRVAGTVVAAGLAWFAVEELLDSGWVPPDDEPAGDGADGLAAVAAAGGHGRDAGAFTGSDTPLEVAAGTEEWRPPTDPLR